MAKYTYQGGGSKGSQFVSKIIGLAKVSPSDKTVKRHIAFLIMQAGLILILAIIFTGYEIRTLALETTVPERVTSAIEEGFEFYDPSKDQSRAAVLGSDSDENEEPDPTPTVAHIMDLDREFEEIIAELEVSPTPLPEPDKDEYIIAIYGDSMVHTMGTHLEYLHRELDTRYPDTRFILYNYGVGAHNIYDGLKRWNKPLKDLERDYPPITQIEADVIIIASFAYNVPIPYDRNGHWLALTQLVERALQLDTNVYMLVENAPIRYGFGFGPNGVNWEPSTAVTHTGKIIEQLENAIGLSETLGVKLIDAYTPSLLEDVDRTEGKRELVNPSDNIHPSVDGHIEIAKIIADTIALEE